MWLSPEVNFGNLVLGPGVFTSILAKLARERRWRAKLQDMARGNRVKVLSGCRWDVDAVFAEMAARSLKPAAERSVSSP